MEIRVVRSSFDGLSKMNSVASAERANISLALINACLLPGFGLENLLLFANKCHHRRSVAAESLSGPKFESLEDTCLQASTRKRLLTR